nr:uncharacterized protein LOC104109852 [Nicotiana tomentosiformis]
MSSSGPEIIMSLSAQPQSLRTVGKTTSVIEQMYIDIASHQPCNDEGFSTLKSSTTEQPPVKNIFKEGSAAGSSILAKLLAERLKLVIDKLVSESENAFIKGRQITYASTVANESIEYLLKRKKRGVACKLDLEKAYDHVD